MRRLPSRSIAKAQSHDDAMLILILGAVPLGILAISTLSIVALFVG
jgi:hypothetical protein